MRLFIAIELPDEVKRLLAGMRSDIPGSRWVPPEQIHLTLAFLGEVEGGALEALIGELANIRAPGFCLRFGAAGCFPDRRRPRVLWIGMEPEARLISLATLVHSAVLACDIPQEERAFSPHITLARLKIPAPREAGAFLDRPVRPELPPVEVREFILFESRLSASGAVHTPVRIFGLL
jgi:2'-5' RNA ligase